VTRLIVEEVGLLYSDRPPSYLSEYSCKGFHYMFGESNDRLVLMTRSWTGVKQEELAAIANPILSCTLWKLPIPALCAAYLRIIMRKEVCHSLLRCIAVSNLSSIVCYSMFDTSYEGSCMLAPGDEGYDEEATAEKDALEMKEALESISKWNFTEETEWARETMLQLV
ncbi:hypothetical protein ACHAPU_006246, partial [Fusarium lateritium]